MIHEVSAKCYKPVCSKSRYSILLNFELVKNWQIIVFEIKLIAMFLFEL